MSQPYSDQAVASSSSPCDTDVSWEFSPCQSVGWSSVPPVRVWTLVTQGRGQLRLFCPVAMATTAPACLWHVAHSTGATGRNSLPGPRGVMAKYRKQRGARPFPEPSPPVLCETGWISAEFWGGSWKKI